MNNENAIARIIGPIGRRWAHIRPTVKAEAEYALNAKDAEIKRLLELLDRCDNARLRRGDSRCHTCDACTAYARAHHLRPVMLDGAWTFLPEDAPIPEVEPEEYIGFAIVAPRGPQDARNGTGTIVAPHECPACPTGQHGARDVVRA